ncbi:unnamed protein product [Coregonus sp. 'balchen']|nr:unnamed protein product [Coregonus sp. 'balchen']
MVELVSPPFHVKRKAGDENVGPLIKLSRLQPLKVPKSRLWTWLLQLSWKEATPTIMDQNATAPMDRQKATKASGSHQSNQVVGRSAKMANWLPSHSLLRGNSITWGMSPANGTLFPGTVNTPPSFGCVRAVPPYLVLSNSAPVSGSTGTVGRLDNGSLVFIHNDMPFFNIKRTLPTRSARPHLSKEPNVYPSSSYPIDTKQPTQDGTAQSGLFRKDEAASTLLIQTATVQADSVQMEIAQTDVVQADPSLTVFAVEETTETDIVQNTTAQPDFVPNETNQAELVQTKTAQMEIVPAQVIGI